MFAALLQADVLDRVLLLLYYRVLLYIIVLLLLYNYIIAGETGGKETTGDT